MFVLALCVGLLCQAATDLPGTTTVAPYTATPPSTDAIMLTRPDGTPIWVNPHAIAYIRGPLEGESGNTTLVFTSGAKQTVKETVEELREIIGNKVNSRP